MARTTGPLLSVSAHGQLKKTLTYATTHGRHWSRAVTGKPQPDTYARRTYRQLLAALQKTWQLNAASLNANWLPVTDLRQRSTNNEFVSRNFATFKAQQTVQTYPTATPNGLYPGFTINTATAGKNSILCSWLQNDATQEWLIFWQVDPTNGPTPNLLQSWAIDETIGVLNGETRDYVLPNLTPGTYALILWAGNTVGDIIQPADFRTNLIVT